MRLLVIIFFLSFFSIITPAFADLNVDVIADGLNNPWEIVFGPEGEIYFTERDGRLWIIEEFGEAKIIETFPKSSSVEGGTLGLALDPMFKENQKIYIYQTNLELEFFQNKVFSFTIDDYTLTNKEIIIDDIPGAPWHDGGRIVFGPDEKLYITTGDAINPGWSQDLSSLAGKILRINSDGTIPDDNPFDSSPVFSYGHRNPQGIAWNENGFLVSSEHGPSGEMGYGHDEINIIVKGKNYGWPKVVGDSSDSEFVNPIIHSGEQTWAPSGMIFYNSDKISSLEGKFLVGALRGEHLMALEVADDGSLISAEKMFEGDFGRIRTAQISPDGVLYLLTANGDNDKIIRISEAPLEEVIKFTSNKSGDNLTIAYVIVGIIVVGVIAFIISRNMRRRKL
ncbi:PQQ-dependent sugar dehydrogenase [Candidatus Nitrosopelagicus sp.]|nr:PQQ-dependent sugar dehydrogenase [Candidatus Nitrosopelagicus sp.]